MNKNLADGIIKSEPKKWTESEIELLQNLKRNGLSNKDIAAKLDRTEVSISIKLKRISKRNDTYNTKDRALKYKTNELFINEIEPNSVLDVYAGNSWYKGRVRKVITNDTDTRFDTDYHINSLKLLCKEYYDGNKYDIIDLDPYGSASECFELAMRMARKGIVITLGEIGHKRWKRLDYIRRVYGITSLDDDIEEKIILSLMATANRCKKELTVLHYLRYKNILRVYCKLDNLKITEQWEKHE